MQEGIAERFYDKLRARMDKLRVGDPLDKCIDIGAIVDPVQLQTITDHGRRPARARSTSAQVPLPETRLLLPARR